MTTFILWMCLGNAEFCIPQGIGTFSDLQTCNEKAIELSVVAEANGQEAWFRCARKARSVL